MILEPANSFNIKKMRIIRNNCRLFMTRNQNEISPTEQFEWFKNLSDSVRPYLLKDDNEYIGYGIIKIENGSVLLTGGIIEDRRGNGVGKFLFKELIKIASLEGLPIELEVLKNNFRAYMLYLSLGFSVINELPNIYKMRLLNENTDINIIL